MKMLMLYENAFLVTVLGALGVFFFVRRVRKAGPLHLATGWNTIHRQWSTWLTGAGAAALGAPDFLSQSLSMAWDHIPGDIKGTLPPSIAQGIGVALIVLGFLAKAVQQRKLVAQARPAGPVAVAPARREPERAAPHGEVAAPPPAPPEQYEAPTEAVVTVEEQGGAA